MAYTIKSVHYSGIIGSLLLSAAPDPGNIIETSNCVRYEVKSVDHSCFTIYVSELDS